MSAHTPGPWSVGSFRAEMSGPHVALSVHPPWAVDGEVGAHICLVAPLDRASAVDEANARLIAAAPELLAALIGYQREADAYHRDCGHGQPGSAAECDSICEQRQAGRAAIAKAKGR